MKPKVAYDLTHVLDDTYDEQQSEASTTAEEVYLCNKQRWFLCILSLILVAVAIPVGVVLGTDEKERSVLRSPSTSNGTTSPTRSPIVATASPTLGPIATASAAPTTVAPTLAPLVANTVPPTITLTDDSLLFSIISTVTSEPVLRDPTSPQHQAYRWMQNDTSSRNNNQLIQRYVLAVLAFALKPSLLQNTHECEWPGVGCDADQAITSIRWANFNMTGILPTEIGELNRLQHLDMAENQIQGEVNSLWNNTMLQYVYLHDNQLSGNISTKIGQLVDLRELYLGENLLTGQLPDELGSILPQGGHRPLRKLSLYRNQIGGTIPSNWTLRDMFWLDLGFNQLHGMLPESWGEPRGSPQLRVLSVDHNQLVGSIPDSWPNGLGNGRMNSLALNDNLLTGDVPGNYSITGLLVSLELQNNKFTSLADDICHMIVFDPTAPGELVNFRVDCEICSCDFFCDTCAS